MRILAATNRDLKKAVADGQFREDLYYRLNVIPITLPPLRQRKEDIPLLAQHFIERLDAELVRKVEGLTTEAMELLMRHDWPGNIRELQQYPGAGHRGGLGALDPGQGPGPRALPDVGACRRR